MGPPTHKFKELSPRLTLVTSQKLTILPGQAALTPAAGDSESTVIRSSCRLRRPRRDTRPVASWRRDESKSHGASEVRDPESDHDGTQQVSGDPQARIQTHYRTVTGRDSVRGPTVRSRPMIQVRGAGPGRPGRASHCAKTLSHGPPPPGGGAVSARTPGRGA
eukprot:760951-Hanusia_phi.AAC.2